MSCETECTDLISVAPTDLENFPRDYVWQGSTYLVGKTFESLQEMFTSTKEIQVCVNIQQIDNVCDSHCECNSIGGLTFFFFCLYTVL